MRNSVLAKIARCEPLVDHRPSAKNARPKRTRARMPLRRETCRSSLGSASRCVPGSTSPTSAAAAMESGAATGSGTKSINSSTATANSDRARSGANERRSATIADATTATATSSNPCSQPARTLVCGTASAKSVISTAEGRVNPIHAATAPAGPARSHPSNIPVCELAGPGKSCVSATHSPNVVSSSQCRRSTNSR